MQVEVVMQCCDDGGVGGVFIDSELKPLSKLDRSYLHRVNLFHTTRSFAE